MSALRLNFYPPSNRRRCVKGRPSYTEPSDNILVSESVNHDFNSNDSYGQDEYSSLDAMQPEDAEEEPITIDLSAFLNENPLLAQSAFESCAENNVASTESSSQFRVTDCETKPSEVHKVSVVDETCAADVTNSMVVNSMTNDNMESLTVKNIVSPVLETVKENCLTTEEIFENSVNHENTTSSEKTIQNFNSVSSKDIMLNGRKTPVKKFTKAKPLGLSNPLKKYKNFMKSKDLNKTNEKVFGKYPVVKCEKLDIENFVKNNKIKVSNWPLHHTESPKSNKGFSRNLTNKRLGLSKVSIKPKLLGSTKPKVIKKPINLNKFLGNFSKKVNNVRGMFDQLNPVSKPVIIRTDSWKPEIANSQAHIPTFFKNLIKTPSVSSKPALGDLLKVNVFNDPTVNYNAFASPEKEIIEKIKGPIVTNVNKFCKTTKSYQRIAPKPIVLSPEVTSIVPCFTKPAVETLTEPVSSEYTVIEPYIEDPSSPQKPKPILTVPIEVISSPEKQNIILHSSAIAKTENIEKIKTVKSVFLNGAVKQVSVPTKIKKGLPSKRIPVIKRSSTPKRKTNKKVLEQAAEVHNKEKDELSQEDASILKARNVVVDAMQNALGQNIKKIKPKTMKKESYELKPDLSIFGSPNSSVLNCSSAYSSILNDFIMSGFNDFEESDLREEDRDNVLSTISTTSEASIKAKGAVGNTTKINKCKSKNNNKRKKYAEDLSQTSDTLSASECEDEMDSCNVLKEKLSLKRKKSYISSRDVLEEVNSETTSEVSKSPQNLNTPPHISVNSSNLTNLNFENKNFDSNSIDSSHSFTQLKNTLASVSHVDNKNEMHNLSDNHKLPDILSCTMDGTLSDSYESSVLSKIPKENANLLKQETSTRTLRERKCSSTEVDKFSDNSSKQSQNNKHSHEKTKSVKGTINSKLKIQKKTPPRSTAKVKIKRKSCKSEDIIREINTITGGHLNVKKRHKNCKKPDLKDNTQNSDLLNINSIKDDSESNSSATLNWNRISPRSFSKRKRTLKVRIKQCRKKKGASCLPLSSLPDVLENSNSTSSLSKSNLSLHSSFREGKGGKKGSPCKEENSSEYSASLSECNMEIVESDKKCPVEEHIPEFAHKDLMVNSPEASVSQDVSNVINSDVSNIMCDKSLNSSLNDKSSVINTSDERDEFESVKNDDREKFDIVTENVNPLNIKLDETYNENMVIEKADVMSESCVESSSEMSKDNHKDTVLESETVLSCINAQSETNLLTPDVNNEHDRNLTENIEVTKAIDSKTISKIDIDNTSEQNSNIVSSSDVIICENNVDKFEDVSVQDKEMLQVKMDSSEDISQGNKISVVENVCSPETMNEKEEIESSFEVHETNNEELGLKSDLENEKEMQDIDSDKSQNNSETDLCVNSDSKSENVQLPYSENFDSDQNVSKPKENKLLDDDLSGTAEPKKCPKIKISFIKNSGDSPDSLSNWFVSETKQTPELTHSDSDIKVPNTAVDSDNVGSNSSKHSERNSVAISSDPSVSVNTPDCDTDISLTEDKSLSDHKLTSVEITTVKEDIQLFETTKTLTKDMSNDSSLSDHLSHNDDILDKDLVDEKITSTFFDVNPIIDLCDSSIKDLPTEKTDSSFFDSSLSDINDISDKDVSVEKGNISLHEDDNPLADIDKMLLKNISSKNIRTSLSDDNSLLDKSSTKDTNTNIELDAVSPVNIKSEPLDEEEDIGMDSSVNLSSHVKSEVVSEVKKKKRGRPRAVSTSKVSSSNVTVSVALKKEPSTYETPKPKGQKKKTVPSPAPTPSTGRKKNYDAELVCVPFSMGWMREHVIRATGKDDNKRPSDIYYFAPDGSKLRSMPDIGTYLSKHPDIKLTLKNFTFSKELIYREPFEIERDAKQAVKKTVTTKKKTPLKSPENTVNMPLVDKGSSISKTSSDGKKQNKSLSENISPPADSKKRVVSKRKSSLSEDLKIVPDQNNKSLADSKKRVVSKRKSSLSEDLKVVPDQNNKSLNDSKNSKHSKQKTLDDYVNKDSDSARKPARSSRKIVKKVPFDNSFENKVPKKPKTSEQQNSSDRNKLNSKNVAEECDSRTEEGLVNKTKTNSLIVHFPKVTSESENLSKQIIDSTPFTVNKSNEPVLNSSTTKSSDQFCPVRTSKKSSKIQYRLKVKFAPRKNELVLHKPCTKFCNFAYSREPSVKCCICLCLFHPECIPFKSGGDAKYACVPCVKTQLNVLEKEPLDVDLPEIDTEILYPFVSLHIVPDPTFDAAFNKFYSPVDQSFVQSCEENNCQPLQICGTQPVSPYPQNIPRYYLVDKDTLNNLYSDSSRPNSNVWYPPMCYDRTGMTASAGLRFLTSTVSSKRNTAYNSNFYGGNPSPLIIQKRLAPKPFGNTPYSNPPSSFQRILNKKSNCNNSYAGCVVDPHIRDQILKMTPMSSKQCHIPEIPPNTSTNKADCTNISPDLDLSLNTPLLQSMLQANNYCAKKVQDSMTSESLSPNSLSNIEVNTTCDISSGSLVENTDYSKKRKRKSDSSEDSNLKEDIKRLQNKKKIKTKMGLKTANFSGCKGKKTDVSENSSTNLDISKFITVNECLNLIFKFLNVHDLLRASLVCKSWKHLTSQKHLWESVTFSGIAVKDWDKCCNTLKKYGTKYMDFRGIQEQDFISAWESFCKQLHLLGEVEEFIFEKVPPFVIDKIADYLPHLKRLTCYCLTSVFTEPEIWSTPCEFKLSTLRYLNRLQALKISSMGGIILKDEQQSLMPYLPYLTHVVLTGFKFNSYMNLESLSQQKELITLELGDCVDIEPQIYGLLSKLVNLQNLCLQNGGCTRDSKLAEALSKLKRLRNLELMNFQISSHLPSVLKKMKKLQHFSIWPDNRFEAAQVNFNSYCAATSCTNLKSICWGILTDDDDQVPNTLELQDNTTIGSKVEKLSFQELFQALVKHYPGVKVEVKCLPRSIWSEFCSTRSFT